MGRALVVLGAGSAAGRGVVEAALAAGRAVLAVGMDDATRQALSGRHPQGRLRALLAPVASDADAAALARRLRTPGLVVDGVVASLAGSHPCGRLIDEPAEGAYDGVILAVAHSQFTDMGADRMRGFGKPEGHVLYDLKYVLPKEASDIRL